MRKFYKLNNDPDGNPVLEVYNEGWIALLPIGIFFFSGSLFFLIETVYEKFHGPVLECFFEDFIFLLITTLITGAFTVFALILMLSYKKLHFHRDEGKLIYRKRFFRKSVLEVKIDKVQFWKRERLVFYPERRTPFGLYLVLYIVVKRDFIRIARHKIGRDHESEITLLQYELSDLLGIKV